jgi:serine/threonine-protein kinase PpkA
MNAAMEISGYQIQSILGEGGMATVYLAIQESLERKVALKVMNASLVEDESFCQRFLDEGKTVAKLRHPAIVTIFDIGCQNSIYYYMAMEYVEGGTLSDRIEQPMGALDALDIIRPIASALGYAHQNGFVHRDVKPANILFRADGSATLTDFGIAKALESDKQLTQRGFAVGTPDYMSPEQARAAKLDGRSDLYSLGIVFYELLTGGRPFVSDDPFATALMHINQAPPRLPDHLATYQPIMDCLLAKNPAERYADARQLINALDVLGSNKSVEYRIDNNDKTLLKPTAAVAEIEAVAAAQTAAKPVQQDNEPRKRFPLVIAAAVLALSSVAIGLGYVWLNPVPEPVPGPGPTGGPPSEEQQRIVNLLEGAEAHKAIGRLREPPGGNAYEAYQMVLAIDPGNQQARRGLREIEQMEPSQ